MAGPYYVRSTDGSDADSGLTWALAKATLAGALAVAAAGERIWVSQAHAETQASAMTLTSAGTAAAPVEILCGNDAAEPPTALATTATVTVTGAFSMTIKGSLICYGITFTEGTINTTDLVLTGNSAANEVQTYDSCKFVVATTASGAKLLLYGTAAGTLTLHTINWINCTVKFAAVGQVISATRVSFSWRGGSLDGTGSIPTSLFGSDLGGIVRVVGVDLSASGSGKNLVNPAAMQMTALISFLQCKLGASVSLVSGAVPGPGGSILLDNCDSGDTNYRMQRHQYEGDSYSETTLIRTSGASDGTTGLSHKHVSSANSKFYAPLCGPEMVIWNEAVGSSQTVTCEILHDSVTNLQDDEVWLETEYLGTSGFPLSLFANDRAADILATPADQAASTETWTTTGLTNPNRQKLVTTQTPQEKGYYRCRVGLAKASYTVYACPKLSISGANSSPRQSLVPGGAYSNELSSARPEFRGATL